MCDLQKVHENHVVVPEQVQTEKHHTLIQFDSPLSPTVESSSCPEERLTLKPKTTGFIQAETTKSGGEYMAARIRGNT